MFFYFFFLYIKFENILVQNSIQSNDSHIIIEKCIFFQIYTSAIYCLNSQSYIFSHESNFYSCKTTDSGGAFYCYNINNIDTTKNCFFDCQCGNSAQWGSTIYFDGNNSNHKLISINQCPKSTFQSWENAININSNINVITNSNISKNNFKYTGGILTSTNNYSEIKFINFQDLTTGFSFYISHPLHNNFKHEYLSFINNNNNFGICRIQSSNSIINNSIFYQNIGPLTYHWTSQNGLISFYNCNFDINNPSTGIACQTIISPIFPPFNSIKFNINYINTLNCINIISKQKKKNISNFISYILFC